MLLKDFYTVTDTGETDGEFVTAIRINKNHEIYTGHFPERPVTPGVILMQLFKEEAERRNFCTLRLRNCTNTKFTAVVDPNEEETLILHSEISKDGDALNLKGTARHKDAIALKINASYKILS